MVEGVRSRFVMRKLAENMIEKDRKAYAVFVDLEKAYDKVCRKELWEALKRYGVVSDLLRAIRAVYQASEACVRVWMVNVQSGLR